MLVVAFVLCQAAVAQQPVEPQAAAEGTSAQAKAEAGAAQVEPGAAQAGPGVSQAGHAASSPEPDGTVAAASEAGAAGLTGSGEQRADGAELRMDDDELGLGILLPGQGNAADTIVGGVPVDGPELVLTAPTAEVDKWEATARKVQFNPDPERAVWLAALFPGLGQVYNRRYWKLPIIVGGFMALGYGTSWNNSMLRDYTRAYADIMDNDPQTTSYENMFTPNTPKEYFDQRRDWVANVMRSRKNFYRRNRDLCIISMVGVYLLAIVDAYVDASLAHFDISPDLSMDVVPAMLPDARNPRPAVGMLWALNF